MVSSGQLGAYPNPTSGKINVTFYATAKEKYALKVTDMLGNRLLNIEHIAQAGENIQEIDLSGLAKGLYLLSMEKYGEASQTMRIVVE
jgi:hypothetical protein